jgi:hypothetical protein
VGVARDRALAGRRGARRAVALGAAAVVALGAAAAVLLALRAPGREVTGGVVDAAGGRQSFSVGGRATAVAEAGASLAWRVGADGAARVDQERGDVFYRVEPGGPFVVATAAGDVTVRGTCFRVEVVPMKLNRQAGGGVAVGAVLSAAIVVTVYEGRVLLANEHGGAELAAGERAMAREGGAPVRISAEPDAARAAALDAPPSGDASRDELLRRDAEQRRELASLRARVTRLEGELDEAARGAGRGRPPGHDSDTLFTDPTPDELAAMAADCRVAYDLPTLHEELDDRLLSQLPPEARDRAAAAHRRFVQEVAAEIRALYVEVTGDSGGAEVLSIKAMTEEILSKSPDADAQLALQRISRERAGLQPPPADLSGTTPIERYYRLVTRLGGDYERLAAEIVGPERASAFRRADGGWGSRSVVSHGCPQP